MSEVVFLDVPYAQKDQVKSLGAKWNPEKKQWYIPPGKDTVPFKKWLAKTESNSLIKARAPLFLVESTEICWKCKKSTPVVTIASSGILDESDGLQVFDFCIFGFIDFLPETLLNLIKDRFPTYFKDFSKTTNSTYYMNHCSCRASLGDFYMISEPGGAFYPTDTSEAEKITLTKIEVGSEIRISGTYRIDSPSFLSERACP